MVRYRGFDRGVESAGDSRLRRSSSCSRFPGKAMERESAHGDWLPGPDQFVDRRVRGRAGRRRRIRGAVSQGCAEPDGFPEQLTGRDVRSRAGAGDPWRTRPPCPILVRPPMSTSIWVGPRHHARCGAVPPHVAAPTPFPSSSSFDHRRPSCSRCEQASPPGNRDRGREGAEVMHALAGAAHHTPVRRARCSREATGSTASAWIARSTLILRPGSVRRRKGSGCVRVRERLLEQLAVFTHAGHTPPTIASNLQEKS